MHGSVFPGTAELMLLQKDEITQVIQQDSEVFSLAPGQQENISYGLGHRDALHSSTGSVTVH
jgi:hypothetical protein